MPTADKANAHCRFIGEGGGKSVDDRSLFMKQARRGNNNADGRARYNLET